MAEDYSKFIHPDRRVKPTPDDLVDKDGKTVFGNFDKEFKTMELERAKKPTKAPNFLNRFKLTLWEAAELHFKEGVLITAVCDMGVLGKTFSVFYDKRNKKVYSWESTLRSKGAKISPNLINGAVTEGKSNLSHIKFINSLEEGKAHLDGFFKGNALVDSKDREEHNIEYSVALRRISKPCVASIPFPYSDNRTLYSQKDFFKMEGYLIFDGERFESDEESTAIIDDHRGYYPRRAHYDWVSTMGVSEVNGEKIHLAFNLTHNQSIDQERYNENVIFLKDKLSILPPVTFTQSIKSEDFLGKGYAEWYIKDEYGMVDITFKIYNLNAMLLHAAVASIDYYITFGELEGFVIGEDGTKYILDGMLGMGEDKTLLF